MTEQAQKSLVYRLLPAGCRAPSFRARTHINPRFAYDSVGGVWSVLAFAGTVSNPVIATILRTAYAADDVFDGVNALLFTVVSAEDDEKEGRIADALPGRIVF